jgi:transketolase
MSATIVGYEAALLAAASQREDVVVMTAENRAPIRSLPELLGARFIDVGICEQTMVGAAAGLALRGRTPVVHALAAFLTMRAFEFIRTDVGIAGLPVVFVGYIPGLLSDGNGPTHQALEDVALMRTIPGMRVVCPADAEELAAALPALLDRKAPSYVRYTTAAAAVDHAPFVLGKAEVVSEGDAVTLMTYGLLLGQALRARSILEARGVPVSVVNMRSLVPVDEDAIVRAALHSELLVVLEDHFLVGGLYSIVAEVLLRHGVACRVLAIACEGRWFRPGLLDDVLAREGFTGGQVAERVLSAVLVPPRLQAAR